MKTTTRILQVLTIFMSLSLVSSCRDKAPETISTSKDSSARHVVASTTWTAAFADIAGADSIDVLAPATLLHPTEYELTVEDLLRIRSCDLFVYATFDRMMKTIGETAESVPKHSISCKNNVETIHEATASLAEVLGTPDVQRERMASFETAFRDAVEEVEHRGWKGARVYCHAMQVPLAKDLGFDIVATFGPAPVTSSDLARVRKMDIDLIVDNVHNPVAAPLRELRSNVPAVVWRNFPDEVARGALEHLVRANVQTLPFRAQ